MNNELRSAVPQRQIRAVFDNETITVYQAYSPLIAKPALHKGTFGSNFKMSRMTWIKPSFLWMMYRCGWATKAGQEVVLAIKITRQGFEEALSMSCLSHFDSQVHENYEQWQQLKERSPVRIQWDPERDINLAPLPWRSLQVGLGPAVVANYVNDWIVDVRDVTHLATRIASGSAAASELLPREKRYPLQPALAEQINASSYPIATGLARAYGLGSS